MDGWISGVACTVSIILNQAVVESGFLFLFCCYFHFISLSSRTPEYFFFVFVGLAARKQFGKKIYGPLESNVTIANDMLARKYITTQQITRNDEQKKKWAK